VSHIVTRLGRPSADRVFIYTVSNFGETDLATGAIAALRKVLDSGP
jgi:hypothetical protein